MIVHKPMINKIKAWLEDEIREFNETWDENVDGYDNGMLAGRAECAEGLLNEIKKWENE